MTATAPVSLFRRDDTFLGVCQAIGDDFGFNPLWLRILFAAPLMFVPVAAISAYLGLGAIVLLSRILAPRPKRKGAAQTMETAPVQTIQPQVPLAETNADQFALPMAA